MNRLFSVPRIYVSLMFYFPKALQTNNQLYQSFLKYSPSVQIYYFIHFTGLLFKTSVDIVIRDGPVGLLSHDCFRALYYIHLTDYKEWGRDTTIHFFTRKNGSKYLLLRKLIKAK